MKIFEISSLKKVLICSYHVLGAVNKIGLMWQAEEEKESKAAISQNCLLILEPVVVALESVCLESSESFTA